MKKALNFIVKQAGQLNKKYKVKYMEPRGDLLAFADVLSAVRLIDRKLERDQRKKRTHGGGPKLKA
jgi:hypothetical protein